MLSENIKSLRKSKGMTQDELATKLNVVRQKCRLKRQHHDYDIDEENCISAPKFQLCEN